MAITITKGFNWTDGATAMPTRLNLAQTGLVINCATAKILGRATAGDGAIEEIDCTAQARSLLDDTDAATMRATLGVLGSNLESDFAAASGVTQAGALGADQVFNAANAPSITLTAGTWFLVGSLSLRTSDNADAVWARFWNNNDSTAFGGGSAGASDPVDGLYRRSVTVSGYITVAGSKTIFFKAYRAGSSSLDIGSASGPAGYMMAVRLNT